MSQATISKRPYLNAALFSGHYLDERVQERDEWDCDDAARAAMDDLRTLYELEGPLVEGYGEDALIDNWIDEVLDVLGFGTQEEVTLPDGGGFVDELLFETATARRDAAGVYLDTDDTTDLFARGIGIVEAKQWDAAFDVRYDERRPYRNASHQTKHYLENTPPNIQWGVLTNGRKWRLYGTNDYETQTYYEVDLPELLERGDLEAFKYFYVFFRPGAFHESGGTTFLDEVWSESETASQELGENLQDNVFTALRVLGRGFVETNDTLDIAPDDEERLDELKEQSLVFLYRLMFVLYAEARGLIHPEGQSAQDEYEENFSLDELRLEVHEAIGEVDEGFAEEFSDYSTTMWSRLEDLFRLIDEGEADLGIPPYNGGLFDHDAHDFLTEHEVSNRYLAEVIYRLSTTRNDAGRYVLADYADLDTRHLGSVYEGLLEHQFRIAPEQYAAVAEDGGQVWKPATEVSVADAVETVPEGGLYVVNDEGERKATGAYYTPDYVVTYIVEETVGPLVDEIREDLREQGFEPGTQEFIGPFIRRITDLRILDPAMGSGHFLTKATGYLSSEVLSEYRAAEVEMGQAFDEESLRRDIAKECIYGVDLNGMAVELAKLSMWLETLAADRPLAFLDHHFKQGNSLVGSDIESIEELESDASADDDSQASLAEFGATREGTIERLMDIYAEFLAIENEGIDDVQAMKRKYAEIEQDDLRQRLVAMANVHTAERFDLDVPGGAYEQMATALEDDAEWAAVAETDWFKTAQTLANRWDFFHWKLAFPETFYQENGEVRDDAGFDAVIGNPPYVSNWKLTEIDEDLPENLENLYPDVAVGHWDLFVPFCSRGVSLTNSSGYQSFITPTSLATEKYARELRDFFIKDCQLRSLVNFGEHRVFEHVDRQYVVYVVSPGSRGEKCEIVTYDGFDFNSEYLIDPYEFLEYSNSMLRIDISQRDISIRNKIEDQSIRMGHLCCVNPGVVAHNAKDSPLDFSKDDVIVEAPSSNAVKYLSGKDIDRHQIVWDRKYMEYYKHQYHFHRPKFPELFESSKIMFSGISSENNRIKSVYDSEGYFTNHNINHATLWTDSIREHHSSADYEIAADVADYEMKYISAIVNSKLMAYYFSNFLATGTLQGSYSSVYPENIRQLPIKRLSAQADSTQSEEVSERIYDNDFSEASEEVLTSTLSQLLTEIRKANDQRGSLSLDLRTYLGGYSDELKIPEFSTYHSD